jgi:AraC-like DNA-binding protein
MLDDNTSYGLQVHIDNPITMPTPHSHDDIELNLLFDGSLEYLFSGRRLKVDAGCLLAFWAAAPHGIILARASEFVWATIPLTMFMHWGLPTEFVHHLLCGEPVIGEPGLLDYDRARSWEQDIHSPNGVKKAAELEIWATMLRVARGPSKARVVGQESTAIDRMRRVIAERYTEDLRIDDVAMAAALHPNHAMRTFRKATGTSIGSHILLYRLAHAKRLLAMTDLLIGQVAQESGFGSSRRLFEVFGEHVGQTPAHYRRAFRTGASDDEI